MRDASGVERTSKFSQRSFVVSDERDGVRSGRKLVGETRTLSSGVDDLRSSETSRKVSSENDVVAQRKQLQAGVW